jgi:hypothetical protein
MSASQSNVSDTSLPEQQVPQNTVESVKLPQNAKIIIPAEKVTPAVKKERTEAQKEAFKKMRAARDESNTRRQFSRKEALEKIDEMKEEERKAEEEEAQRKAKTIAEATGAAVVVQKKRGRKPGEKIPYGGKQPLNIDAPSPPISAVYSQPIEKQPHYKAPSRSEPLVKPQQVQPVQPVYENPYLEMIRRKKR